MTQEQKDKAIAAVRAACRLGTSNFFSRRGNPRCALGHMARAAGIGPNAQREEPWEEVADAYGLVNDEGKPNSVEVIYRANDLATAQRKRAVIAAIEAIPLEEAEACPAS